MKSLPNIERVTSITKMIKNMLSISIIFILITVGFIGFFIFENEIIKDGSVQAEIIYVDSQGSADYTSIQAAIDAAKAGDTIYVKNGSYYESITLNKNNITLIGNSSTNCKIIYHYSGSHSDYSAGINITSYGVNIAGFNISVSGNNTHGIYVNLANKISISNNIIGTMGDFAGGIYILNSNNNTIFKNDIQIKGSVGGIGIYGGLSHYNIILSNSIISYCGSGIHLSGSDYNHLIDNNILKSTSGISLMGGNFNDINGNKINTTKQYGMGIKFQYSSNNWIRNNNILTSGNEAYGIYLYKRNFGANNLILNNVITTLGQYVDCISIDGPMNTTISDCVINNYGFDGYGVYLNSNDAKIINTRFHKKTNPNNNDIVIENDGVIDTINTTIEKVKVNKNGGGLISVMNYLRIDVFDDDGITPVFGVDVEIKDNNNILYSTPGYGGTNRTTNGNGEIDPVLVMDRQYKHKNNPIENITSVKVKKFFTQNWEVIRPNVNMNTTHTEIFYHDITNPPEPTGLQIKRVYKTNVLNVSWNLNTDTINYEVQTNKSGQWNILCNISHPQNWTLDENLQYNNWYYYKLKAWDKVDFSSEFSEMVGFYLEENKPPKIPTGLNAKPVPNNDALNVSWNLNSDDTINYELWWKEPISNNWSLLINMTHPKRFFVFANKSLINGSSYNFKIRAWDDIDLFSDFSMSVSVVHRDFISPDPPTNLTTKTISETIIELNWNLSTSMDVKGYNIYLNRSGAGSSGSYMLFDKVDKLSSDYDVKDLKDNTKYYFLVKAYDEANNTSPNSNIAWNTTIAIPEKPKIIATNPDQNSTDVPVNSSVIITFNIPMNTNTVSKVFKIIPLMDYNLNWTENYTILHIDFIDNLSYSTSFTITIGMAMATNSEILENWPFILNFKTETKIIPIHPIIPTIKIISPENDTQVKPGESIIILGTSTGFGEGTVVMVILNSNNNTSIIGSNGNWTIMINTSTIEGNYTIMIKIGNQSDSVSIIVKDTSEPDEDGKNDNDEDKDVTKEKDMYVTGQIIGLTLILVIIIILIILMMVMRRKKLENENVDEKDKTDKNEEILYEEE
jgi:parallel beta-helix repeat protein